MQKPMSKIKKKSVASPLDGEWTAIVPGLSELEASEEWK